MSKLILKTNEDLIKVVSRLPDTIEIYTASFNVSTWESRGAATAILQELDRRPSHLLVGVPMFRSCTGDYGRGRCKDCYSKHNKNIKKLAELRDRYTNIDWRFVTDLHAKFWTAGPLVITGGRNISDGKLADLSLVEKDPKLADALRLIWNEYAAGAYDIGTKGPLVFTTPYKGEMLADSTSIPDVYKQEVIKIDPEGPEGHFWSHSNAGAGTPRGV